MWAVRAILILLLLILAVAFVYANFGVDQLVDVKLEPLSANRVDVPLVTVVFWSFLVGAILSMLFFVTVLLKQWADQRSGRKRVRALEEEVRILRNRPIEESADLLKGSDKRSNTAASPFGGGEKS